MSSQTLGQFLGILQGKKSNCQSVTTNAYHLFQKDGLFDGLEKNYQPKDEDGDKLPSESKLVQQRAKILIKQVQKVMADMLNIAASVDYGNCEARADIVVNDNILCSNVPVYTLLLLDKQLLNLKNFISAAPVLSPSSEWTHDENSDLYMSNIQESTRTTKITRPVQVVPPTKEHPAIVKDVSEDIIAGFWKKRDLSGRLSQKEKDELLERVNNLRNAVISARELANTTKVSKNDLGDKLMAFIFDT